MRKIDERENTLFDIRLWDECKEIACCKDITLSVSSKGYDVDRCSTWNNRRIWSKGYIFTDLQELYAFLRDYSDE